jgi:hypothetical protein
MLSPSEFIDCTPLQGLQLVEPLYLGGFPKSPIKMLPCFVGACQLGPLENANEDLDSPTHCKCTCVDQMSIMLDKV